MVCYPYPLPLVPAPLKQLWETELFTKLNLHSTYNLVHIREGDEWKTALHTTKGHYEYLVMAYSLTNAPAVFQSFINEILKDILGRYVIDYIDDILIYSRSYDEHVHHVKTVLARLLKRRFFVKGEKCEFYRETITSFVYMISRLGVEMDQGKVRVVTDWPEPTMVKELQCFLGFINFYCRFIHNYSSVACPLITLLRGKPKGLKWSKQAQEAFTWLKRHFSTTPILRHPDPDRPFIVEVDTSSCGIGAVLSQRHGSLMRVYPCVFFSRKLTPAEANYDVGNRELLSIKAALEE
ncbi:hypothetical protein QTP70_004345 [Hemibagrus guttatus]|uniref:ribonuclease H n=1 Tax=Hemibagrus guttatus TaxID=175788 RepID=A0AAE0QI89_9TELE|nr:hypothetical protein QTP70_004345 [Hemibagrus guttatus]